MSFQKKKNTGTGEPDYIPSLSAPPEGKGLRRKEHCAPLAPREQSHASIQELPGPDVSKFPSGDYSARSRQEAVLSSGHESLRTPQRPKAGW